MDIETFHEQCIEGNDDQPWAAALRRLCHYRHCGELTGHSSAALSLWAQWYPADVDDLQSWTPWNMSRTALATWEPWVPAARLASDNG
ncbi:MAG: hypothetical protein K0V04_07305 [Deltaproteobacteria bacterium]|nr:hypothetical protein [Deltaproteobacteria bacterium]